MTLKKNNKPDASGSNPSPESLKILLADDVPINVALATKLLTRRGHQVVSVVNGQLALEQFKEKNFDVVLMDVQMPIMDGLEATKQIREFESQEKRQRTPVIALTANDEEDYQNTYFKAGMDGIITKPLNIKAMIPAIRKYIADTQNKSV